MIGLLILSGILQNEISNASLTGYRRIRTTGKEEGSPTSRDTSPCKRRQRKLLRAETFRQVGYVSPLCRVGAGGDSQLMDRRRL